MKFGIRKLESWATRRWRNHDVWHNTGAWQTDRRCCRKTRATALA